MSTTPTIPPHSLTISRGRIGIDLTSTGEIKAIRDGDDLLINQYRPTIHESAVSGIYLRRHHGDEIETWRLVGSDLEFQVGTDSATWTCHPQGWQQATVTLTVDSEQQWHWLVALQALPGGIADRDSVFDVVFSQDLAMSPPAAALSSEPYVCQYLAHHATEHPEQGWRIASRQTMTAGDRMPTLLTLMPSGAAAYLTDGMQFFGTGARASGTPLALQQAEWTSENYQYELSSPTLLSRSFAATADQQIAVIQQYHADYQGELEELALAADGEVPASNGATLGTPIPAPDSPLRHLALLSGEDISDEDLLTWAGEAPVLPEYDGEGRLWSFFTPSAAHYVSGRKELAVERPHGHIVKAGTDVSPSNNILSASAFAAGVFTSHVVLGNTTFNRVVGVSRHPLQLMRSNGVRLSVGNGTTEYLLGVPSAFSIDLGQLRWLYVTELGRIEVRLVAEATQNRLILQAHSDTPLEMRFSVGLERDQPWTAATVNDQRLVITPAAGMVADHCPGLTYVFDTSGTWEAVGEGDNALLLAHAGRTTAATLCISGDLDSPARALEIADGPAADSAELDRQAALHHQTIADFTRGLMLAGTPEGITPDNLAELNILIPWYVHNALIHMLVPHGLEQYSGAAWGTRDICQGPFELMMSFGHFDSARQILQMIFSHQQPAGDFPQWFMFDQYRDIYADSSHGDVIVWPLFALAQYLHATGDRAILSEEIPAASGAAEPLTAHLGRLANYLETHRIPGTGLPAYGEGDWDDTLQPADPEMRTKMASGWTTALLVQACELFAGALGQSEDSLGARFAAIGTAARDSYRSLLLPEGILAGYAFFPTADQEDRQYILHPLDERTGIHYRLIPMTRSIIAGLFTPEEAERHLSLIDDNLHFPDGVRLMNRFAPYQEGPCRFFLRAEQAANVGREIGLMYTHAHIRYIEALAAWGSPQAFEELLRISPFGLNLRQPQALPRQRNTYYSSSDADFADRFKAAAGIEDLRQGDVDTKGGWRIYSSGPGIFLHQMVRGVLGIRLKQESVVFDPVLPAGGSGLTATLSIRGRERRIRYVTGQSPQVRAGQSFDQLEPLPAEAVSRQYRAGGLEVSLADLGSATYIEVTVAS